MDDLTGLSWSSNTVSNKPPPMNTASYYPSLRPTPPLSGRSTPLSAQPTAGSTKPLVSAPSKPNTPSNDSFSNLVSFASSTSTKGLSLQEQQTIIEEQKAKQNAERRKLFDAHFGVQGARSGHINRNGFDVPQDGPPSQQHLRAEGPGAQRLSNSINKPFANISAMPISVEDEDDILAAFDSTAPVDTSSNFPVPSGLLNGHSTLAGGQVSPTQGCIHAPALHGGAGHNTNVEQFQDDEDDIFGLGKVKKTMPLPTASQHADETDADDVLGLLGKPLSELPQQTALEQPRSPIHEKHDVQSREAHSEDQAIAELVDMGFSAAKAKEALGQTESRVDIQAAVGWLLSQAHEETRQKSRRRTSPASRRRRSAERDRGSTGHQVLKKGDFSDDVNMPAWMRQESRSTSSQRREDSRSPANGEKDAAQLAAEIGNNLFKSANSLWKTGTRKMQQAVSEFNSDSDSSQPKWMRSHAEGKGARLPVNNSSIPGGKEARTSRHDGSGDEFHRPKSGLKQTGITDEAMMLESNGGRPSVKVSSNPRQPHASKPATSVASRELSPASPPHSTNLPQSQPGLVQRQQLLETAKTKLNRQALADQSSLAYTSPARRKRPQPKPAESEPDLLLGTEANTSIARPSTTIPTSKHGSNSRPSPPTNSLTAPTRMPTRLKAAPREIPSVSASALSLSASHRHRGTEAYKLGDYAAAHSAYTSALAPLPDQHPIIIVILCNRALTSLKVGEPKAAVCDADIALSLIGPSHGEGKTIVLAANETPKDMRDFYGKALMRKAEALEQMERWDEAAKTWREAVESGHGGSTSIQGRDRSEKAAGRRTQPSAPVSRSKPPPPPKQHPQPKKQSALDQLTPQPTSPPTVPSTAAVTRLRAANAAAERADDEKFALADSVDARLSAWKNGKQDNLRALLGSLDSVLWPEAGWKKVGLHELVLANKVKVVYMRGIAKVHPDKLPPTATTEQRMVSGAVFSTLNEAWDKFKRENGL